MDYFNLVSLDTLLYMAYTLEHFFFFSACTDIQILFCEAALGRKGMALACACRLSPMLELPNVRADIAHRYPSTHRTPGLH